MEVNRHTALTDKCSLHFFELSKMVDAAAIDQSNEKEQWLALFNAETEEELTELAQTGGAVMSEAIQAYRGITATQEFMNLERMREKTTRDEAQALGNAARRAAHERDTHWQGVVEEIAAEKDAIIAALKAQLGQA